MRKLIWTCTLCSVMLFGAVISTAHFAVHHPQSLIGRILHGASYAAAIVNPVRGLTPLAAHVRCCDAENGEDGLADPIPADPEAVPEDPIAVPAEVQTGSKGAEPGPIVVANTGSAPIVIPENDKPNEYIPLPSDLSINPVQVAGTIDLNIECPSVASATAPRFMPYCEEEECETLPMPAEEPELLPMPHLDEEEEGCTGLDRDPGGCSKACGAKCGKGCHLTSPVPDCMPGTDEATPKCDDEPCHQKACPHTDKVSPTMPRSEEEPSEPQHLSVRKKVSIYHFHRGDENGPRHLDIDTMEYRPSDRHLYDYGPGSL